MKEAMDKINRQIGELIDRAQAIVVLQADNPDSDSLGSALALLRRPRQAGSSLLRHGNPNIFKIYAGV
jgi:nanoRNase/pAp phosphatase (c-di-AMP/oligoRNAs hydrolase)